MTYKTDFPLVFLKQYHLSEAHELYHNECDFIFVLSGQISIINATGESRDFTSSQLTFLHSKTLYTLVPGTDNIILHIALKTEFIEKYIAPDHMIICDSVAEPNRNYLHIKRLLMNIADRYLDDSASHELSIYGYIFQLSNILLNEYTLRLPEAARAETENHQERILQIQEFISQNYHMPITLNTLADHLHLTAQYLSRYFKTYFGINFNEYLNNIRLQHALHDILYSQKNITEIAIGHGFPNSSTFNRQFRKAYALSPREYRKQYQSETPAHYEWSLLNRDISQLISSSAENIRDISVDISAPSKPFTHNFCDLINVGFAKNLLTEEYQKLFIRAHEQLSFRYVRLEGLISSSLIPRLASDHIYYFKSMETILNFLRDMKLIPFIEIGKNYYDYFQSANTIPSEAGSSRASITQNLQSLRKYGKNKNFQQLFLAFLKHAGDLYEEEWTSRWIFEFWQTPGETIDDYLDGYECLSDMVHKYLPGASFGGPGYNTINGEKNLSLILSSFVRRGIVPDYFSAHFFSLQYTPDQKDPSVPVVSAIRSMSRQQDWIIAKLQEAFHKKIPFYITEFNSSLLMQTYVNESCYQAAYLCHNLLSLHEHAPLIGFWMLSDLSFSLLRPDTYLPSGISMINRSGIRMPAYHAYALLNRLGTGLIEKGEHYCITTSEEDHFQILTYHYTRFNGYNSLLDAASISLKDIYSHFEDSPPVQMSFHLSGLKPGIYRIRRFLLDRSHGSLLDIQIGGLITSSVNEATYLYKIQTLPPSQIRYLTNTCVPEERVVYLDIEHQLNVETTLGAHNVCLWDIVREY